APLLPALLLFFVLSEWVRTRRHVVVIYASLTATGLLLSATFLAAAWLSGPRGGEAWALVAPSPLLVVSHDLPVVAAVAPLAVAIAVVRPHPLVRLLVAGFFAALITVIGVAQSRTALVTAVVSVVCFFALTRGRAIAWSARAPVVVAVAAGLAVVVDALLG